MKQKAINRYGKYLVIAAMVLLLYMGYVFSFKRAFEAVGLNKQLTREKSADQSLTVSYPQLEDQHQFYVNALKAFHVQKEDRENRLWQTISAIAISKGVNISLVPNMPVAVDTIAVKKGIVTQAFTVKGPYFNMVKLLDSIAKTNGIGRIAELKLSNVDQHGDKPPSAQLTLQLSMVALAK